MKPSDFCQKEIFMSGEGDGWFQRNAVSLEKSRKDRAWLYKEIALELQDDTSVLEIGCADGSNLAGISDNKRIKGFGIDPSPEAIQSGSEKYPDFSLSVGSSDNLVFQDSSMGMVWMGFCLYLVDRSLLMATVAEVDRVLQNGGLLIITDFDPGYPVKRPYSHVAGCSSWKMDYSQLWLANPAYSLVRKISYSHYGRAFHPDPQERVATWILKKSEDSAYSVYSA